MKVTPVATDSERLNFILNQVLSGHSDVGGLAPPTPLGVGALPGESGSEQWSAAYEAVTARRLAKFRRQIDEAIEAVAEDEDILFEPTDSERLDLIFQLGRRVELEPKGGWESDVQRPLGWRVELRGEDAPSAWSEDLSAAIDEVDRLAHPNLVRWRPST